MSRDPKEKTYLYWSVLQGLQTFISEGNINKSIKKKRRDCLLPNQASAQFLTGSLPTGGPVTLPGMGHNVPFCPLPDLPRKWVSIFKAKEGDQALKGESAKCPTSTSYSLPSPASSFAACTCRASVSPSLQKERVRIAQKLHLQGLEG